MGAPVTEVRVEVANVGVKSEIKRVTEGRPVN